MRPLTDRMLRGDGREAWAAENGAPATQFGRYQVHHRVPLILRWLATHIDPSDTENLVALPPEVHSQITTSWERFRRLHNFEPSVAAFEAELARLDNLMRPHIFTPPRKSRGLH